MRKIKEQKGFTLVELAIVLVIVGLLIGGILKGQELMHNSRVTASVAQIKGYEAAVTNFYDMYKEKPGDLYDPGTRIKECEFCTPGTGTMGNGKVGVKAWDVVTSQSTPLDIATSSSAAIADSGCTVSPASSGSAGSFSGCDATNSEAVLFWYELLKTGLISGVTSEGVDGSAATPTIGGTIPAMKVGGGFWAGNASGKDAAADVLGKNAANSLGIRGTILVTVNKADQEPSTDAGIQVLYPKDAANIDRKIDDGLPNTGNVESYGATASGTVGCVSNTTKSGIYAENVNSKDCGLIIRVFK